MFRARDSVLERDVAVKVLPSGATAGAEQRRRFEREAKVVATLSHPGIVPVFDVGETDGVPFIVQELVDGETVAQVIRKKGPIEARRSAEWGAQAADALASAHAVGVLHRDVKPENLIVGRDGRVRILDFGLAKVFDRRGRTSPEWDPITRDGIVVGTVDYLSPEQAEGREIDARSDIFSLGVVLYEMAAGRRPFDRPTRVEVMNAILFESEPPIGTPRAPVPAAFASVVGACLKKSPRDRTGSMREVSAALRRFLLEAGP